MDFPKESAGRLMTEKFVQTRPVMTAGETLEHTERVTSFAFDSHLILQKGLRSDAIAINL